MDMARAIPGEYFEEVGFGADIAAQLKQPLGYRLQSWKIVRLSVILLERHPGIDRQSLVTALVI